jgi:phage-related minor tail protein
MAKDLELALRIRADLKEAKKEVQEFTKAIEDISSVDLQQGTKSLDNFKKTAEEINNANLGKAKQEIDQLTDAADDLGKVDVQEATKSLDEFQQAADDLNKTDLGKATEELDGLTDTADDFTEAASTVKSGADTLGASANALIKDFRDYEDALASAALSHEQIAEQEQRLDRLMLAGSLSVKEYDAALEHLNKAEAKLVKTEAERVKETERQDQSLKKVLNSTDKAAAQLQKLEDAERQVTAAFNEGRISATEYDRAMAGFGRRRAEIEATRGALGKFGLTSRDTRSQIISLTRSLASGNWESAGYDILRLGSSADKTGLSFLRLAGPISAVVALIGGYAAVTYAAWVEQRRFENMLSLTGNAAGVTRTEYDKLTRTVADGTEATIGQSKEIVSALMATGRVGENMVNSYARAIVRMQTLTGRSTDDLVKEFTSMEAGIASWAAEQNKTMHFLTLAQFEQIRALEERGRVEEAMQVVLDAFAQKQIQNAGLVESSWLGVKNVLSETWAFLKSIGADQTLEQKIEAARAQLASLERDPAAPKRYTRTFGDQRRGTVEEAREKLAALEQQLADERAAADKMASEARVAAEGIAASRRVEELQLQADAQLRMNKELDQLKRDFDTLKAAGNPVAIEEQQSLEKDIRKKYEVKPETDPAQEAAERYLETLQNTADAATHTTAELRRLESQKLKLNPEQRAEADKNLGIIEEAEERAAALKIQEKADEEAMQQAAQDAQELADLKIQLLRAEGKEAEAQALEIEQRFGEMRARLVEKGDDEGVSIIDSLINLEDLQQQLEQAEEMIDEVLERQHQRESEVTADREAGLITEYEARRRIIEIHQETTAELMKQKPILEELAKIPGAVGDAAQAALEALNQQAADLARTVDLFKTTMSNSIESGLTGMLEGLTKGTMNFRQAITHLATTVVDSLIKINAEKMAQTITGGFTNSGWGGAIMTGAKAIFGFAKGGLFRGKGSGTSDDNAIAISDHEFITQAARVKEPGALGFLEDFNKRGMKALRDWTSGRSDRDMGYDMPAPSMSAPISASMPTMQQPAAAAPGDNYYEMHHTLDAEGFATKILKTRAFSKAVGKEMGGNPKKYRKVIGS